MNFPRVLAVIGGARVGRLFIPQIFKDLLRENAETHRKLGEIPLLKALENINVTREEYIVALKKMYGLYAALEPRLEKAIDWSTIGIDFNERRRLLIESLRNRGNLSDKVLYAMMKIPREKFLDSTFHFRAYEDTALPIDANQTISQPYTVAYMTSLLDIEAGDKILEIGTGSGYQACILAMLGAKVYTIERISTLVDKARKIFQELELKINTRIGDGTIGWSEFAPYKGIIVTAAAPEVPESLVEQLDIGGKLVVPVGTKSYQSMFLIERKTEKDFVKSSTDSFKFVPLIGKEGWKSG